MFGRSGKETKTKGKDGRKRTKDARKGRGGRARETIRETSVKTIADRRPSKADAGPPLRIPGGTRKQVSGTTPEEVVRNTRRKGRCSGRRAMR